MEITVDTKQMEALKSLADTNIKIGEAKEALSKLKSTETEYLKEREEETLRVVAQVLKESAEVIALANKNFTEVQDFHKDVSSFAEYLVEAQKSFSELVAAFEEHSRLRNHEAKTQLAEIAEQKKVLKIASDSIAADRRQLDEARLKMTEDQKKIADDRATLDRAIKRLKEGKI